MRNLVLGLCCMLIHSCSSPKRLYFGRENLEFKENFFRCIDNVESYTIRKKNKDSIEVDLNLFKNSLASLNRFTEVDYSLLTNFEFRYPNYKIFESEKEKWIKWYERYKNKNLQW